MLPPYNNSLDRSGNQEAFICEADVLVEAFAARSIRALDVLVEVRLNEEISKNCGMAARRPFHMFSTGQLTQSELLPFCQEITNLQQQLNQVQNELKQIQVTQQQTTGPQAQSGTPNPSV